MQDNLFRKRFLDRGYSDKCLKKVFQKAKTMDILLSRPEKNEQGMRIILSQSKQHKQIRDIPKDIGISSWSLLGQ